ncbi:NAD-dependent epimerase/dehydratase family protein [Streptomyces mayteni]
MRVLVTGAAGRLGRALLPGLVAAGHDVRAMSRRPTPGSRRGRST